MPPEPQTVIEVLESTARRLGARPALRVKRGGEWRTTSWTDYAAEVRRVAKGLLALGLQPGQGVVIMGYNRPEWFIADVARDRRRRRARRHLHHHARPSSAQYIADHCEAAVAVVENRGYLEIFLQIRDRSCPSCKAIVLMEGESRRGPRALVGLAARPRRAASPRPSSTRASTAQKPDDVCTLIYTSGTTGEPKAVMLSHRNVVWTARQRRRRLRLRQPTTTSSRYLPLVAHRRADRLLPRRRWRRAAAPGSPRASRSWARTCARCGRTSSSACRGCGRRSRRRCRRRARRTRRCSKKIAAWARGVGPRRAATPSRGEAASRCSTPLAKKLVFSKVRAAARPRPRARLRHLGGADLARHAGVLPQPRHPDLEVYGMSECTGPATFSLPGPLPHRQGGLRHRRHRAGDRRGRRDLHARAARLPGLLQERGGDARDARRRRVAALGRHRRRSTRTASCKITDRKKELIITSGGKNIAPQLLEGKLKADPGRRPGGGDRRPQELPRGAAHPRPRTRCRARRQRRGSPAENARGGGRLPASSAPSSRSRSKASTARSPATRACASTRCSPTSSPSRTAS